MFLIHSRPKQCSLFRKVFVIIITSHTIVFGLFWLRHPLPLLKNKKKLNDSHTAPNLRINNLNKQMANQEHKTKSKTYSTRGHGMGTNRLRSLQSRACYGPDPTSTGVRPIPLASLRLIASSIVVIYAPKILVFVLKLEHRSFPGPAHKWSPQKRSHGTVDGLVSRSQTLTRKAGESLVTLAYC